MSINLLKPFERKQPESGMAGILFIMVLAVGLGFLLTARFKVFSEKNKAKILRTQTRAQDNVSNTLLQSLDLITTYIREKKIVAYENENHQAVFEFRNGAENDNIFHATHLGSFTPTNCPENNPCVLLEIAINGVTPTDAKPYVYFQNYSRQLISQGGNVRSEIPSFEIMAVVTSNEYGKQTLIRTIRGQEAFDTVDLTRCASLCGGHVDCNSYAVNTPSGPKGVPMKVIRTVADLKYETRIRAFRLAADLDFAGFSGPQGSPFFSGIIFGEGHKIKNLNIPINATVVSDLKIETPNMVNNYVFTLGSVPNGDPLPKVCLDKLDVTVPSYYLSSGHPGGILSLGAGGDPFSMYDSKVHVANITLGSQPMSDYNDQVNFGVIAGGVGNVYMKNTYVTISQATFANNSVSHFGGLFGYSSATLISMDQVGVQLDFTSSGARGINNPIPTYVGGLMGIASAPNINISNAVVYVAGSLRASTSYPDLGGGEGPNLSVGGLVGSLVGTPNITKSAVIFTNPPPDGKSIYAKFGPFTTNPPRWSDEAFACSPAAGGMFGYVRSISTGLIKDSFVKVPGTVEAECLGLPNTSGSGGLYPKDLRRQGVMVAACDKVNISTSYAAGASPYVPYIPPPPMPFIPPNAYFRMGGFGLASYPSQWLWNGEAESNSGTKCTAANSYYDSAPESGFPAGPPPPPPEEEEPPGPPAPPPPPPPPAPPVGPPQFPGDGANNLIGTAKSSDVEMLDPATFSGWSSTTWTIQNGSLPVLTGMKAPGW